MPPAKTLVIMPTYNESETILTTVSRLFEANPDVHLLVVDDASPDGTGAMADGLAAIDPRITVMHRTGKDGLGRAYLAGFAEALARGYDVIVEMDADGSHPADALPAMLEVLDREPDVGLVIGSRWVEGGGVVGWPLHRLAISRGGSWYARTMLGLDVRDVTAGYRAYRADVLREIGDRVASRGYAFQIDMTLRTARAEWRIAEVPITFREREAGTSKMSLGIVVEAMALVTRWGIGRLVRPAARRRGR